MALLEREKGTAVTDHGGSLGRARALFPQAPEPWVDLSTGINPHSYPLFELPATALSRLPEPARVHELNAIAAAAYGVPSALNMAAAPGTQILLPRVAALVEPGRALVLGPTYAEHARAATIAGHDVSEVADVSALADADLAIIVNPNNPDGRLVERETLLELARALHAKGGLLVVDEAFMDVGPREHSVARDTGQGGLIVLKSFGKFFGLAGLRLGFAIAAEPVAQRLEAEFGPWAVAGPALEYGVKALGDHIWQNEMRERLQGETARLDALLLRFDIPVRGGTPLFRYLEIPHAAGLFDLLGEQGILVRNFAWSSAALRIGLPGGEAEWTRLERALQSSARQRVLGHRKAI
ncbi:threonine-phosphate decarboxylase CobD [Allomesorhizobium camelthorni]|uniref:threonine-phosphate decarboxylase n=1 Tax=Allomesorhizobium camelthorni TaxID=475069 RepID=A0A6G4W5T9_9HYPH|nr:threonine-phosphate decarboxylase CobD [Mesorhizobium camelthorni]NGO50102.1 threonine-phosphate decarboxylase [Mesorhizobium camelthorni]